MQFFLVTYESSSININGSIIKTSNSKEPLRVTIDSNFTFEEHVSSLCAELAQNYMPYLEYHHHKIRSEFFFKKLITLQFDYCLLVWMCHSRILNNIIKWHIKIKKT